MQMFGTFFEPPGI